MTKDQLQGCLISVINLLGHIPGWVVYIYLLNTVGMPTWIWVLYLGGLVWSTTFGCISLIITISSSTKSYQELLKQFEQKIEQLVTGHK